MRLIGKLMKEERERLCCLGKGEEWTAEKSALINNRIGMLEEVNKKLRDEKFIEYTTAIDVLASCLEELNLNIFTASSILEILFDIPKDVTIEDLIKVREIIKGGD